ncbi:MAG: hypothetical protein GC168_16190 [Candidatus Hydrogenedens sp.]|nr:hypothetical protein [Candidatus Hydrogenedens sp.]
MRFATDQDGDYGATTAEVAPGDDWDRRSAETSKSFVTGDEVEWAEETDFGSEFTDITLSTSYNDSQAYFAGSPPADPLERALGAFPANSGNSNTIGSNLPGSANPSFVFDFSVPQSKLANTQALFLNLLLGDFNADRVMVRLTTRAGTIPPEGPIETCLQKQRISANGEIQNAFIPLDGTPFSCSPYEQQYSLSFDDIFEAVGDQWHAYLEVEFIDSEDSPEDYAAIDFIELAVDQLSLNCRGDCNDSGRFERIIIGDVDGFGWLDGEERLKGNVNNEMVPVEIRSSVWNVSLADGTVMPVNADGYGLLGPGDFLPDIDGRVGTQYTNVYAPIFTPRPGDDWDNRDEFELAGDLVGGRGFDRTNLSTQGSQWTDLTLSLSYSDSKTFLEGGGPDTEMAPPRVLHTFPTADGTSLVGSNQPGKDGNQPFIFDFYVDAYDINPDDPLFFNMIFGDYDVGTVQVFLRTGWFPTKRAWIPLTKQATNEDGLIQAAYVELDGNVPDGSENNEAMGFHDIFRWENGRWHAKLNASFFDSDTTKEPYTAFDFVELSTDLVSTGIIRVDGAIEESEPRVQLYATIQEAIDTAAPTGNTIIVEPGTYEENIDMKGKNVVLRSTEPLNPDVTAVTILDGGGVGPVITMEGSETRICVVTGFTIQNGDAETGGGIAGNHCEARIISNVIKDNVANFGGGVANMLGELRGNVITANTAEADGASGGRGGGVYNCKALSQNDIYENSADHYGAGVYDDRSDGEFHASNNKVRENTLTDTTPTTVAGAGIHLVARTGTNDRLYVVHNTIIDNSGDAATVNLWTPTGAEIGNCIIWGNSGDYTAIGAMSSHSVIEGGPESLYSLNPPWNSGDEPTWISGTLRPAYGSPAINRGYGGFGGAEPFALAPPVPLDFDNLPRDTWPDSGVYEYSIDDSLVLNVPAHAYTVGDSFQINATVGAALLPPYTTCGEPVYIWKKDGTTITASDRIEIYGRILRVNDAQESDSGEYTLVINCGNDPESEQLFIDVIEAPLTNPVECGDVVVTEIHTQPTILGAPIEADCTNPASCIFVTDPWFEMHNTGGEQLDLSGWGLSDDPGAPFKYVFPSGTMIGSGEDSYKIFFLPPGNDGLSIKGGGTLPPMPLDAIDDYRGFTLNAAGGLLILSCPASLQSEGRSEISYPSLLAGQSWVNTSYSATPDTSERSVATSGTPWRPTTGNLMRAFYWWLTATREATVQYIPNSADWPPSNMELELLDAFELQKYATFGSNLLKRDNTNEVYDEFGNRVPNDVACNVDIRIVRGDGSIPQVTFTYGVGRYIESIADLEVVLFDTNTDMVFVGRLDVFDPVSGLTLGPGFTTLGPTEKTMIFAVENFDWNPAVIVHELGHFAGLGHTLYTENTHVQRTRIMTTVFLNDPLADPRWMSTVSNCECEMYRGAWRGVGMGPTSHHSNPSNPPESLCPGMGLQPFFNYGI